MKNILYIAPYYQADGWGYASLSYLYAIKSACDKLGYKLYTKDVQLSDAPRLKPPASVLELETYSKISSIDTVIQKCLPQALAIDKQYRNIGISVFETHNLQHSSIKYPLSQLDHLMVPSSIEKTDLEEAGVSCKISHISQPIDCDEIDAFKDEYADYDILNMREKYKDYVKFYFMGADIYRKNIKNLIIAFSTEFTSKDKAVLVIKTDPMDKNSSRKYIENIKQYLNKHNKYRKNITDHLIFIPENIDRKAILSIHNNCDIFVCASRGEAFCRPLAEAMRFGNTPMAVENTGPIDFVSDKYGYIIKAQPEQVIYNTNNEILEYESEFEYWMEPSIFNIRRSLRRAYSEYMDRSYNDKIGRKNEIIEVSQGFHYNSIGERICTLGIL